MQECEVLVIFIYAAASQKHLQMFTTRSTPNNAELAT